VNNSGGAKAKRPARFAIVAAIVIVLALASLAVLVGDALSTPYQGGWPLLDTAVRAVVGLVMLLLGWEILKNSGRTGSLALVLAVMIVVLSLIETAEAPTQIIAIRAAVSVFLSLFIIFYILLNRAKMRISVG
jgi:hypothetical protein